MQKIVFAKLNNCLMSAQKVRLVANLIRGKSALQAKDILIYTHKAASKDVLKTLESAIANCIHNENYNKKELQVAVVNIDEATTYKRGRAVARGRHHEILRRNCHIKIGLVNGKMDATKKVSDKVEKLKTVNEVKSETKTTKTKRKMTKKLTKKVLK